GKPNQGRSALTVAAVVLAVVLGLIATTAEWNRWREATRLVTPHPAPSAVTPGSMGPLASPQRFWGTYRPQVYFGMKTRSPRALVTGLMWLQQGEGGSNLRHTCEQSDGLSRYGWLMHDGEKFGVQEIRDGGLLLKTTFVKRPGGDHGGDWSWRITAKMEKAVGPAPLLSLFFYVATDGQGTLQPHLENGTRLAAVTGMTEELGNFTLTFLHPTADTEGNPKYASYNYLDMPSPGLHLLTEAVRRSLSSHFVFTPPGRPQRRFFAVNGFARPPVAEWDPDASQPTARGHLLLHQVTLDPPASLEVVFESGSAAPDRAGERLAGAALTAALEDHVTAFERRFEETFGLSRKGFPAPQRRFAQAALSDVLGGIGYFHGHSLVQTPRGPLPGAETTLLTAVPSRSFFPRGFLWDEGFHQLLVARWDVALAREVLAHWLDLLTADGWIPREQILGEEARTKVPPEFLVQHTDTANPPTLLLALERLLPDAPHDYLRRIFPRLRAWHAWYNRTQAGALPHTFRWRGRDSDTHRFLNPKTLASGLDDYPRASHPSTHERHLDLHCWMALAARVLGAVAERLNEDEAAAEYRAAERALSDNALLDQLHWAPELGAFADYGNHSTSVALRWHQPQPEAPGHPPPAPQLVREVREPPRLRFVDALGYVSLFPLLLGLLRPDSPRLPAVLSAIRSEQHLWTQFGLRSLAPGSPFYMRRNTQHDPPYWRGSVWVNINYLALQALWGYSQAEGPQRERAADIYRELRHNLVANVYRQFTDSGFMWENYNDRSGRGQGCRPFAGWTALVVLVMAEDY
ncbi:MOGS glucosidase, partial [Rhinopomastus cyanomelas]|nr:MOGS glucosidase [Rhinopomastus cyanomelas]